MYYFAIGLGWFFLLITFIALGVTIYYGVKDIRSIIQEERDEIRLRTIEQYEYLTREWWDKRLKENI
jgi:hypothetical protein